MSNVLSKADRSSSLSTTSHESILALIDQLGQNLTQLYLNPTINEFSQLRKDFKKKAKLRLWDNLLLKRE